MTSHHIVQVATLQVKSERMTTNSDTRRVQVWFGPHVVCTHEADADQARKYADTIPLHLPWRPGEGGPDRLRRGPVTPPRRRTAVAADSAVTMWDLLERAREALSDADIAELADWMHQHDAHRPDED